MSVVPKRPKGPPLNAMRAFEAAARHVSFVDAAEELNVTPGAISQHIKSLEGWAGAPLFRRNAQGVELTTEGLSLVPTFTAAFDHLADATRALRNLTPKAEFHIAALPAVAQLWLPKRLGKIRERFPSVSFSVTAMETPPSLSRELFDLSVFFVVPDGSPSQISVCPDEIVPVCSPVLLDRLQGPDKFGGLSILHDQTWSSDWADWSRKTGVFLNENRAGPQFSLYSLAVEEAKAGAGLLMGHLCLVADALAAGSLVRAHEKTCHTDRSLAIEVPEGSRQRPETDQIVTLLSE